MRILLSLVLAPMLAQTPTLPFSGSGARVVERYLAPARYVVSASHDGEANFVVSIHSPDGVEEVLVNEIGAYVGERVFHVPESDRGIHLVAIQADGRWTVDIQGAPR